MITCGDLVCRITLNAPTDALGRLCQAKAKELIEAGWTAPDGRREASSQGPSMDWDKALTLDEAARLLAPAGRPGFAGPCPRPYDVVDLVAGEFTGLLIDSGWAVPEGLGCRAAAAGPAPLIIGSHTIAARAEDIVLLRHGLQQMPWLQGRKAKLASRLATALVDVVAHARVPLHRLPSLPKASTKKAGAKPRQRAPGGGRKPNQADRILIADVMRAMQLCGLRAGRYHQRRDGVQSPLSMVANLCASRAMGKSAVRDRRRAMVAAVAFRFEPPG